jgi:flagellar M-ring protein FliF
VSVECDFTSAEQAEETYDPNRSVMTSSAKTEDVSGAGGSGGVPGTASNLPRPPARVDAAGKNVARRTENIQFQTSRSYRKVKIPQGQLKRVSVAILVDQNVRWEGAGAKLHKVLEAPAPERLKVVKDLVAGVAGIQPDRGDQVLVESLPFESTLQSGPPEPAAPPVSTPLPGAGLPPWLAGLVSRFGFPAVVGASLAVALCVIVVPLGLLLRRRGGASADEVSVSGQGALPASARAPALTEGEAKEAFEKKAMAQIAQNEAEQQLREQELLASLSLPVSTKKGEVLKKHIAEQARKDPVAIAQLVRTWLSETET